jgi:hypothetical protein
MKKLICLLALVPACGGEDGGEDAETQGGSFELTVTDVQPTDFEGSAFADLGVAGEATFTAEYEGAPDDGAGFRLTRLAPDYRMVTGEGEGDSSLEYLSFVVDIGTYDGPGTYTAFVQVSWRGDDNGGTQPTFAFQQATCTAEIGDDTLGGSVACDVVPGIAASWVGAGVHFN